MGKEFYCVYCNRMRSGTPDTDEEATEEHFIPRSIGGRWTVIVCRKCNRQANATSDLLLNEISWSYELYRTGILEHGGFAQLHNGQTVQAAFKVQTKPRKGSIDLSDVHYQFYWCKQLVSGAEILKRDIKYLDFYPGNSKKVLKAAKSSIAKIALASISYLANNKLKPGFSHERIIAGLEFADLRRCFLGEFNPGGRGKSNGVFIKSLLPEEAKSLLLGLSDPDERRHYVSLQDTKIGVTLKVCLYSEYFWTVTIPGVVLNLPALGEETKMPKLYRVNLEKAGAFMYLDGQKGIRIAVK